MNEEENQFNLSVALSVAASVAARAVGELAGSELMGGTVGGQTATRNIVETLSLGRIVNQIKAA